MSVALQEVRGRGISGMEPKPYSPPSYICRFLPDSSHDRLKGFQSHTDILIPPTLTNIMGSNTHIEALSFEQSPGSIGRLDQEYTVSLAALLVERNGLATPTLTQEQDGSNWAKVLNIHRSKRIREGIMSETDKAICLLLATHFPPDGVFIESYIQAESIRGRGVGRAFFTNLDRVLRELKYGYWYGENREDNIGFFLKMGAYKTSQVYTTALHPCITASQYNSVKFLDPTLERGYVLPQFLGEIPCLPFSSEYCKNS